MGDMLDAWLALTTDADEKINLADVNIWVAIELKNFLNAVIEIVENQGFLKEPLEKNKKANNILFVLSSPSGVGKSTVCSSLINFIERDKIKRFVSTSTRPPRTGEIDGVDYFFVSKERFLSNIKDGVFLEYAITNDEYYESSTDKNYQKKFLGNFGIFWIMWLI